MNQFSNLYTDADKQVRIISMIILVLGLSVLSGWIWDIDTLKRVLPGMNTMKANTAIGFVLSGSALLLLSLGHSSSWKRGLIHIPSWLLLLIGLLTFSEFVFNWNPDLDQLFFIETEGGRYSASPGRMSAFTAICFFLLGIALLLIPTKRNLVVIQILALIVGGVSLLALGGNMFGDPSFPNFPRSGAIAIHTAFSFLLLSIGILMATYRQGLLKKLHSQLLNIAFGFALLLLLVASIAVYKGIERTQKLVLWVDQSHNIVSRLESATFNLQNPGKAAFDNLLSDFAELEKFTFTQPDLHARVTNIGASLQHPLISENIPLHAEISEKISAILKTEKTLLAAQQRTLKITNSASIVALSIATSIIFILLLTTYYALQQEIARRKLSEEELSRHRDQLDTAIQQRTVELAYQNRRNELILNTTIDGFFAAGLDGRILDVNPAYCTMLGYTRAELLLLSIADVEARENPQEVMFHIAEVIAKGHDRFDTCHRLKDGNTIDIEISVNVVELGNEKVFYAFVRDITPRITLQATLMKSLEEAERANSAKSDFLSSMSHELRTPMNAILGFSQLMSYDEFLPEQHKDNVQEILNAGSHLLELINEVLDLSRIESGHIELKFETVDVSTVIMDCLHLVVPAANKRSIRINSNNIKPMFVRADRMRLKQSVLNLLSNAVKYNRKEGSISIDLKQERSDWLRIMVSDTGIGIAPERYAELFQPFNRLDADKSNIEGTGIGLTITKRIVEMMGGSVGVRSQSGVGSTFWIELPVENMAAPAQYSARFSAKTEITPMTGNNTENFTVLCIEDNPANLRLIEQIISQREHTRFVAAPSPELGIEYAQSSNPDLILLDINMPGMDGYEVLKRLKDDVKLAQIPVVAVSAAAMPRDIERGMAAGFSDYIIKPLDIKRFRQVLDTYLSDMRLSP